MGTIKQIKAMKKLARKAARERQLVVAGRYRQIILNQILKYRVLMASFLIYFVISIGLIIALYIGGVK